MTKENIIELFGLDKMNPKKAGEMAERIVNLAMEATLMRALPMLNEADMGAYEKLLEDKSGVDAIFSFLNEKVEGFDKIMSEELENLRSEMASDMAQL